MRKEPAACPSCGTQVDTEGRGGSRKAKAEPAKVPKERRPAPEKRPPAPAPEPEFAEAADEEKDEAIEDTADLGEDEDIGEVIEAEDERER
jgi:hypothetical protein